MRVVNVQPKDVYVTFEMSINEIDLVLDALDRAEIEMKEGSEAVDFLKDTFFKTLDDVVDQVKGHGHAG